MDNWTLRENNDSPVGVNGFVDNMQLLWKLQSLEPLAAEENDTSQSFTDFNQTTSASDMPDDDDLVDKLFRESLAMQDNYQPENNNENIQPPTRSEDTSLSMLLSTPPPLPPMDDAPMIKKDSPTASNNNIMPPFFSSQSFQHSPLPPFGQILQTSLHNPMARTLPSIMNPPPPQPQTIASKPNHSMNIASIQNHPITTAPPSSSIIAQFSIPYTQTPSPPQRMLQPQPLPLPLPLPPPTNVPAIPPRPQLRLHFSKHLESLDSPMFDDLKDPMKPDLDVTNLRRLTVATLRTLGVYLSFEDLPAVDIEDPLPTDSQQVLPAAAMQLITTMVLGTSGDKDVSQTLGSQISNGDLVALQRMIVAGLRSKNIVIHTVLNEQQPATGSDQAPKRSAAPGDKMIDLTHVRYEPPHNVTRLFLRLYRYILNMLLSTPDCWPFIQPVPETAFLYHQEIKHPMDLYTIEENVWHGKYTKFARFEKDMQLIWKNARAFHRNAGTIPKHAENLEKLFTRIVMDIKRQIRKQQQPSGPHDFKFDPTNTLPEESDFSYPPIEQVFSEQSTVYTISALSPLEPKARKPKGLTNEKLLYLQLNGPFFQAVERMKSDLDGNHLLVPRFYIAKNRTLLRQIRSQGVLAIFYNTKTNRVRASKNIHIETDMILAYPASELFDIDQINECTDDFAAKGWIHLRPLRVVNQISFEVNETIERDYFKRMFATSKMAIDDKSGHHNSATKKLLKKVVRQILGLPEIQESTPDIPETSARDERLSAEEYHHRPMIQQRMLKTKEEEAMEADEGSDDEKPSPKYISTGQKMQLDVKAEMISNTQRLGTREINHEVWRRLFNVCTGKGVQIRNITSHGNINWNSPNSEGFFKRVYFFDNIVVQAFRQMTMYQRITEVACLMKLKNLPHMAQMREVLYNDNGDVAGLSMERYQTTLKQYAHVHSHHRLTAYQKYDVIYQMLICMKIIHEAGLAHRDLSEVNIMVNTIEGQFLEDGSEKVYLYLIDFGKAVFCEAKDVRDWFVDVPRAEWEYDGDVVPESKEELDSWCESLPWVKGKPDHGYRMYRSIQTLPKTRSDNQVLPWLIHPQAEDMYSIGVMIWKVFTDTEPWRGILDTDLQGLRYVAEDDYRIQRALEGEVHGELSRQLLLKCLKTRPQDRDTAKEILDWITQDSVREGLIGEWKMYSSDTRGARRAKNMYGFEESNEEEEKQKKPRRKINPGQRQRGRPKLIKDPITNT
ncbi:histone acetyltransferase [Rhizopus stolonifer]|uniref:Histone acetyltransferase n=1 Tax=Rhizopus stolonifer TaxID=4846 RepID=A0A367KPT4_RHIST|nr:histone acetyltransferase [Rhizopus stolonifer]